MKMANVFAKEYLVDVVLVPRLGNINNSNLPPVSMSAVLIKLTLNLIFKHYFVIKKTTLSNVVKTLDVLTVYLSSVQFS